MTVAETRLDPIRIGVHPGSQLLYILRARGLLEAACQAAGLAFEWVDVRRAQDIPSMLARGDIAIAGSGAMPAYRAAEIGVKVVFLGSTPPRPDFGGLVAGQGSGIVSAQDLVGRRVSIMLGSWHEPYLAMMMAQIGCTLGDLTLVDKGGQGDAFMASGPAFMKAQREGMTIVPPDAARPVPYNVSTVFADEEKIACHPEFIETFQATLRNMSRLIAASPKSFGHIMAAAHPEYDADAWGECLARMPWRFDEVDDEFRLHVKEEMSALLRG